MHFRGGINSTPPIMKKLTFASAALIFTMVATSCGVSSAVYVNHNQSATQVVLSSNNYKVVEKITGSAEVSYVFLIGGTNQRQLYENAYSDMVKKANLVSSPRALVHVVNEENYRGFFPFYFTRRVTYTAHVVEFIK